MPLTAKGEEILGNMKEQYGAEKGEQVFHASKNKGTITGVDQNEGPDKPGPSAPDRPRRPGGPADPSAGAAALPATGSDEQLGSPFPQFKGDAAKAKELDGSLPTAVSHQDLAARSREMWERGAGRPAPFGVYGDSKPKDGKTGR